MTTWETYNWDAHNPGHYEDCEWLFGCILVQPTPEGKRVGLIKIPGIDGWHLPHGSHEKDSDSDGMEIAMRALGNHFTDGARSILDDLQIKGTLAIICDVRKVTWTEEALNEHIRDCESRGARPFWNRPGKARRELLLYRVNVSESDITKLNAVLQPNVVEEIRFFRYSELVGNEEIDKRTLKALSESSIFQNSVDVVEENLGPDPVICAILMLFLAWLIITSWSPYT